MQPYWPIPPQYAQENKWDGACCSCVARRICIEGQTFGPLRKHKWGQTYVKSYLKFRKYYSSDPFCPPELPSKTYQNRKLERSGEEGPGENWGERLGYCCPGGRGGCDQGKTTTPSNLLRQCFLRSIPRKIFLYVDASLNLVD